MHSAVWKRRDPNPAGPLTLRISALRVSSASATSKDKTIGSDDDLRASIPAYTRIGSFLATMLKNEILAAQSTTLREHRVSVFAAFRSADDIVTAFKQQLEAYARQEAPFRLSEPIVSPRVYWRELQNNKKASVLAVRTTSH